MLNDNQLEASKDIKYLKLLSKQYPSMGDCCARIIKLEAILSLPKGTEHYVTDLHGEYAAFSHVLKNASGVLKLKIDDIFGDTLSQSEKSTLATLMYYPEQKLEIIKETEKDMNSWYEHTLIQLIKICRVVASKYTITKVRKALPKEFSHVIEELIHEEPERLNKNFYFKSIVSSMISTDSADRFIIIISKLIQRLAIDHLHIVGDIYDRGPDAHLILDDLMNYHSLDIQWGNHDILWMGAATGSEACIANVIRICTRYANLKTLEDGYGINLLPLATFALEYYNDDPCDRFKTKFPARPTHKESDLQLISKMHKAMAIIQFKVEGQLVQNNPQYKMQKRLLLDKIDYDNGSIMIDGKSYPLNDTNFPTIDPLDPYALTADESELLNKLKHSFLNSEKLQKHIKFLYAKGSMYLVSNSNLLFHACIPMYEDGTFKNIKIDNKFYNGKALLDKYNKMAMEASLSTHKHTRKLDDEDIMWYLWCGEDSPLFGKEQMTTFEQYFIDDKATHKEVKNPYFAFRSKEEICDYILEAFDLDPIKSHIISGHVPVKFKSGESPIKANGKMLVIDGGYSKAYQDKTGTAGYTLIYNSYGLRLASHEPFESIEKAIKEELDIKSDLIVLEKVDRKFIGDTDKGKEIQSDIDDLKLLLEAYQKGLIKEME